MAIVSFLIALLFSMNVFSCEDNFNGKFVDENSDGTILEIKVLDCSPQFELSVPSEKRIGHVLADNVDRVIWNQNGRTVSEKAMVQNDILTINIVDNDSGNTFFQNQIYKLTPKGLEFSIEIFNSDRSYDYTNNILYIRK